MSIAFKTHVKSFQIFNLILVTLFFGQNLLAMYPATPIFSKESSYFLEHTFRSAGLYDRLICKSFYSPKNFLMKSMTLSQKSRPLQSQTFGLMAAFVPYVPYSVKLSPVKTNRSAKTSVLDLHNSNVMAHSKRKSGKLKGDKRSFRFLDEALDEQRRLNPEAKFEIFPVGIAGRAKELKLDRTLVEGDLAFYQNLVVKTEKHPSGLFFIRNYQPLIARGAPKDFVEEVNKLMKEQGKDFVRARRDSEEKIVERGEIKQLQILKRFLVFALIHFGRRGWNVDPRTGEAISLDPKNLEVYVDEVIRNFDYYDKQENLPEYISIILQAIKTRDQTTYQEIFRINEHGQEEIMGLIGQTVAPYGVVEFFNLAAETPGYEAHFGKFGSRFNEVFYTPVPAIHEGYTVFDWSLVNGDVPALPVEKVFNGKPEERPWIEDAIMEPYLGNIEFAQKIVMRGSFPKGILPDGSKPIVFGTGEIVETVKHVVDHNLRPLSLRNLVRKTLVIEMAKFLFAEGEVYEYDKAKLNLHRKIYTFNPAKNTNYYIEKNFEQTPDVPAKIIDGELWIRFGTTAKQFNDWLMSLDEAASENLFHIIYENNRKKKWSPW